MRGFGSENYYLRKLNSDYYIPIAMYERFKFLSAKIERVSNKKEYSELYAGLGIQFRNEFDKYRLIFSKGDVWFKDTESWMGNDEKGTPVKIVKITDNFIFYKKPGMGYRYCLNKFSFVRIFAR